jgi:hypothetical protein
MLDLFTLVMRVGKLGLQQECLCLTLLFQFAFFVFLKLSWMCRGFKEDELYWLQAGGCASIV